MMRPRALAAAALVTLLLPIAGVAQPAGITRSRLANGFTVIVRENPAAPVVGYSLLVKMGTRTETPETAGISHMLQLMLVRGTDKMSGEEIVAAADRMGGTIDAYGDEDYSEITATALSRNWQPMLELVGAVALRPTVPDGTLTDTSPVSPTCATVFPRKLILPSVVGLTCSSGIVAAVYPSIT